MRIKRLRLAGFKSFVEPADLVIREGLTGVVGPNGCGKSNLLEALRWAMGEGSAKSLRGAGMDDVIFAGTATRPPRDFAEVSILIERADDTETEVVRRIERGAGSAYRIDGRDVRARDVGLLFADAATGAHSPALVSQNRIGAVIAAKPADRRQMLEEAAGIAGLHVRRRDAEMRLRATEANLARLDEVLADQGARVASLRRQARAAERYRDLSDRIRLAEARMIYARWRDAKQAADAAKADAEACEAAVQTATDAEAATAALQHEAAATSATARADALVARDRASEAGHELAALKTEAAGATRRLTELETALVGIADDRTREGSLATDAAAALEALAVEGKRLDAAIVAAAAQVPVLEAALAEAERAGRDAEVALAQAMSARASEAAEARVAAAALAAATTRLDRAAREVAEVTGALGSLPRLEPLEAERAAAARRARALIQADAARTAIAKAEGSERTALAKRDADEATRATARAELAAIDSEIAVLERTTKRGGAERLVDRCTPRPGYERALAAALGDDLEAGPAAWAGAAVEAGDPAPIAGADVLANHVAAPDLLARRLAQVFVVDADAGQTLAVGQRLVTRGGALRRWDGFHTAQAGGATAERLERRNRLTILTAARPAAAAAVATAEAARAAIDVTMAEARTSAAEARARLARAETEVRDAQRSEDSATTQAERLAGRRADLDTRATRLGREHDEAETERARAAAAMAALPDGSASAARAETLSREAGERRLAIAEARAARLGLDRTVAADRERRAAALAEVKSWRTRAGEAAKRIAAMAVREEAIRQERDALAPHPALLAVRIAELATEHDAARTALDSLTATERDAEHAVRAAEARHRVALETLGQAREARAGAVARVENQELRRVEMGRLSGERFGCPAPVLPERLNFVGGEVRSPADESRTHEKLSAERERIGPVNLVAERELAEVESSSTTIAAERAELGEAVAALRGSIQTLNREGRQRLRAAFEAVDGHFRRLFATLFDGGAAHLELVDSDDPLEAGLEIMAQPPGKRLQSLTLLSGGEQALTAVALIFALFLTNPAPICVLDEVDAPLDDANIERFCDLLDRMTQETATRYLIVTHNAVTMSRMHRLFGVTMIERGVSRLVSVDLQAAETLVAAE
ncbi:AAA family ATPase [Microvirga sp. SRT01]|uniref:Chromosome partition protein Smc n=1 Tax=Sphingomonas longa TaxID=2778730 RepID=A0ABS2D8A3_9SPHN|nr:MULTISPECIES: AAA family ATPase [Alphaproteobacteria]MBM6577162.1 AAA family ATPase [Sphingomonas sp. BT552]MBR7710206.1 AAA family ATPase [Microvirga sp. SRT01]